jgi:hypothetical protein
VVDQPGVAGEAKRRDRQQRLIVEAHLAARGDRARERRDADGEPLAVELDPVRRELVDIVAALREEHEVRREREPALAQEQPYWSVL